MTRILPIIISVPHAGLKVPDTVKEISILTENQIRIDGDEGAEEIYDFEKQVSFFLKPSVARAFVDLNRRPDDFTPDGVVKTHTCQRVQVYKTPLSNEHTKELLKQHYYPWQAKLTRASGAEDILFGIDCHTMAETAPPIALNAGTKRPRVCLSNAGTTCPDSWLEMMAEKFENHFGSGSVGINQPFQGGYIIRQQSKLCPWIQLEISRENFTDNKEKNRVVFDVISQLTSAIRHRNK